jgi:hypothetical protein
LDSLKSNEQPPDPRAVSALARASLQMGEHQEALMQFKAAVQLNPGFNTSCDFDIEASGSLCQPVPDKDFSYPLSSWQLAGLRNLQAIFPKPLSLSSKIKPARCGTQPAG